MVTATPRPASTFPYLESAVLAAAAAGAAAAAAAALRPPAVRPLLLPGGRPARLWTSPAKYRGEGGVGGRAGGGGRGVSTGRWWQWDRLCRTHTRGGSSVRTVVLIGEKVVSLPFQAHAGKAAHTPKSTDTHLCHDLPVTTDESLHDALAPVCGRQQRKRDLAGRRRGCGAGVGWCVCGGGLKAKWHCTRRVQRRGGTQSTQ